MSSPLLLWCLYDSEKDKTLKGLTFEELRFHLSQLPLSHQSNWLVWREDWTQWKVATQLPKLFEFNGRPMNKACPPIPEEYKEDEAVTQIRSLYQGNEVAAQTSTNAEVVAVSEIPDLLIESEGAEFVPRAHPRIRKTFEIHIECNGQKFATTSVDVSVGGLFLARPLPDWVFGYCTITIIKPSNQESVQLTCSIVENQPPQSRYRVALSPLKRREDQIRLHNWLSN